MAFFLLHMNHTEANARNRDRKPDVTPDENEFNRHCKAVVSEMQYEDEYSTARHQDLNCEFPDGQIYTVEDISPLWAQSNLESEEIISGDLDLILPANTMVDHARGKIKLNGPPELRNRPDKGKRRKLAQVGDRTVLVVRVQAPENIQTSNTMAELADSVFGADSGFPRANDPVNLRSQYKECSYEKLRFGVAANRARAATNYGGTDIFNGAVTVDVTSPVGDGHVNMRNDISAKLNNMFGVSSPTELADYLMYCLPPGTMRGIAYAFYDSWMSVYSDVWCTYVSAQVHEIGHNLNLGHSNENGAYNDQSGMMGLSYSQSNTPAMCFNAAKSWQLGWYEGTNQVKTISLGGTRDYVGQLSGIINYNSADVTNNLSNTNPILIKLNQNQSPDDYYITYNAKASFNSGTMEGGNQVMVVRARGEGNRPAKSELVAKLSALGSYTITGFDGTQDSATIEVSAIDISIYSATIQICIGECGSPPAPTPPPAPFQTSTPTPSASLSPSPFHTSTPTPSSSPSPSPFQTLAPTLTPTATPSPSPFQTSTPTPSASPSPSPTQRLRTRKRQANTFQNGDQH